MQLDSFVKFFEADQEFFIKIDIMIMLITLTKQIILIHSFSFDEKTFIHIKKFNKKN